MKKLLVVLSIMVVMLSACDLFNSVIPFMGESGDTPPSVTIPTITPTYGGSDTSAFPTSITFTSATSDVAFYYTINGTTPTTTSESGNEPFSLPSDKKNAYTVKVIAEKDGDISMVAEKTFKKK